MSNVEVKETFKSLSKFLHLLKHLTELRSIQMVDSLSKHLIVTALVIIFAIGGCNKHVLLAAAG